MTKDAPEFENLPNLFSMGENNGTLYVFFYLLDWRTRQDAVQALIEFGKRHAEGLAKSKQLTKYMDNICKLLQDSNVKVSTLAINSFVELVSTIKVAFRGFG
jgi:hypothetical protein